jgi:hypothetical protein
MQINDKLGHSKFPQVTTWQFYLYIQSDLGIGLYPIRHMFITFGSGLFCIRIVLLLVYLSSLWYWLVSDSGSVLLICLASVWCCDFLVFVLCLVAQCCHCLWIVHSWFSLRLSRTFICMQFEDSQNIRHNVDLKEWIWKVYTAHLSLSKLMQSYRFELGTGFRF